MTALQLAALGIDQEATSVYHALLDLNGSTRAELVLRLELPGDRIDTAVLALAEASLVRFVASISGRPEDRQICPVNPRVGLTAALARRRERVLAAQAEFEQLEVNVAALISVHESLTGRSPNLAMEFLEEPAAATVRIRDLVQSSRVGISVITPEPGGMFDGLLEDQAKAALRRGVRVRQIHLGSIGNRPAQYAEASRLVDAGARTRTAPTLPVQLMIFDGTTAVLPHVPKDPDAGAVVISHQGTVASLDTLFDRYWLGSEDLGCVPGVDEHGLTAVERELLRQLSDGATDETASRRMGVSVRTVRRITAQLMTRLDAKSRFQAGCRAAARGWM
ncbi:LuxR C-terminal-related transcriptional regulator [Streptomyces sp. NBC_00299]|uniref:LuxR C-terminal-related transcriptional regulator n=1 Tax=Streptomyces sp. NBC_00299 TaxID=2975705 RepID=UPI002E2AD2CF|nr:LuxR C-terminal-related transcriptional regulator [Streptomyces sp. NBC_00299]